MCLRTTFQAAWAGLSQKLVCTLRSALVNVVVFVIWISIQITLHLEKADDAEMNSL